jgi:2-keto-4-pentenoate hydratase/2-oxohepta-3-ene-1,7-dioic acid hydratase in catechol pathway
MGFDPDREPPFYFTKPANAIVMSGATIPYALGTQILHYEMELVIAISKPAFRVSVENAQDYIYGYACGLDMTRRDLQRAMGDQKKPWEIGKSFDHSAPIGPLFPVSKIGHFKEGNIQLSVNGVVKQKSDLNQMIWSVAEQIVKLSEANELFPGDIIYSGTPENVGPVVRGDVIRCQIQKLPDLVIKIV